MNLRDFGVAVVSLWCCLSVSSSNNGYDFAYPLNVSPEEDGNLNMQELVTKYGYPIETHKVVTRDGYILTMYRIPHSQNCKPKEKVKIPVLVQHGLLSSSFDFVISGPKKALAYLLADECYDVWLGNNRGNSESKNHTLIKPTQKEFWTFSWHEMGKYDLPALIDHILNMTGQPNIHYIGHSQGTTQFFVFGAFHPEYHHKIRSMHALAPVAYMKNLASPIVKLLTAFHETVEKIIKIIGANEIFPNKSFLNLLGSEFCKNQFPELQKVCCNVLFLLSGFDEPQLNKTVLPAIFGHTPAGAGAKQIFHYVQGMKSGEFRQFDYGAKENLKIYNSKVPPKYDVTKINIPIAFYYGRNDFLTSLRDIKILENLLPNIIEKYLVPYTKFNHHDFLFATDARHLVYYRILEILKKY